MPSILFVCTANQFRSPLAAACLLKNIRTTGNADGPWIIESAGTWVESGLPVPGITLRVADRLKLVGLDQHFTRQIDRNILDRFNLIIVMEMGQREALQSEFPSVRGRLCLLSEIVDGLCYDVADPAHSGVNPYEIGQEIFSLVSRGTKEILQLAQQLCRVRICETD